MYFQLCVDYVEEEGSPGLPLEKLYGAIHVLASHGNKQIIVLKYMNK